MNYDGYTKYVHDVAINYDIDRQEEEHWTAENNFIENICKNNTIRNLLEVPVGTGRFLPYYKNINEVIGIDISNDMLEVAKKRNHDNVKLIIGDAFNLGFLDNHFQYVVCFRLLHLIPLEIREKLLVELGRVTGEKLIIQVYIDREIGFFEKIVNKLKSIFKKIVFSNTIKPWFSIESFPLSEKEFKTIIDNASLKIISSTSLCQYGGTDVKIYELSKK